MLGWAGLGWLPCNMYDLGTERGALGSCLALSFDVCDTRYTGLDLVCTIRMVALEFCRAEALLHMTLGFGARLSFVGGNSSGIVGETVVC